MVTVPKKIALVGEITTGDAQTILTRHKTLKSEQTPNIF
jgi:hypothetical protein